MKKVKVYKIILIVVVILSVVGITYGFFASQIASGAFSNILVGTSSTDSLTFSKGNDINIVANQANFIQNGGNIEGSTIASAKLIANNDTKMATRYYSISLDISKNGYVYTSGSTPELMMTVTDPSGEPVTVIDGLNYTTSGGITGFDITTKQAIIYIKNNKEITTTNYTTGLTENWTIKVYFINLNSDQQANTGKSFKGSLNIKSVEKTTINSNNENIIGINPNERFFSNLKIHGKSFQKNIPLPSTSSNIVSMGNTNKIDIINGGKNIFNINTMNFTNAKKLENDVLSFNDGIYDRILYKQYWEPKKSTDYTIVFDILENTYDSYVAFASDSRFYFENIRINIPVNFTGRKIINVKSRADYSSVTIGSIWLQTNNKVKGTFKCKLMIIEGSLTDSSTIGGYESYRDDSLTTINLNNHEPLRSLGDISDYIDYENNRIIRNIGTKTFDGSEVWHKENYNFWTDVFSLGAANNFLGLSTHFSITTNQNNPIGTFRAGGHNISNNTYNGNVLFNHLNDTNETLETWKSWLLSEKTANNPLIIHFPLRVQKFESITLPPIKTFNGTNKLTISDGTMNPSKLELTYYS